MTDDNGFAAHLAWHVAGQVRPLLDQRGTLATAGAVVEHKNDEHTSHRIDYIAESALFRELAKAEFRGTVFSEESGLSRLGSDPRIVICDPYCNTSLTFRGIRESAVAVYEFSATNTLLSAAIADLQLPRVAATKNDGSVRVTWAGEDGTTTETATVSPQMSVEDAFVVLSLLKAKRRQDVTPALLRAPKLMSTIDGAIVSLRIAVGEVDAFVDLGVGQPTYEALSYILVKASGGVVADSSGSPLEFRDLVDQLRSGEVKRHPLIAASSNALLHELRELAATT